MRFLRRVILALIGLAVVLVPSAQAQDQGVAAITTPLEGATVSGSVPILGTATHPQFQRYELAFGYDPNPTDTWFSIQAPAQAQIVNEVLGRWDTAGVTDGVYALRLRVYWTDRLFSEAVVHGVKVRNAAPALPQPVPPTDTPAPAGVVTATPTPVIALPPTSTPRPTTAVVNANTTHRPDSAPPSWLDAPLIGRALFDGVLLTGLLFAVLGLYAALKAALRYKPKR